MFTWCYSFFTQHSVILHVHTCACFCPVLCDWALHILKYCTKYQVRGIFNVAIFLPDLGIHIKRKCKCIFEHSSSVLISFSYYP